MLSNEIVRRLGGKLRENDRLTGERLPPRMLRLLNMIERNELRRRADDEAPGGSDALRTDIARR
jgi:hypothetical protein